MYLLVVNLNRSFSITLILRIPILWFSAIRYSFTLIWITFHYARCLHILYKQCGLKRNTLLQWVLSVYRCSLPIREIVKLFWPIPPINLFAQDFDDRRYKSIYHKLCAFSRPSLGVVDAPKARKLQAILMQDAFKRYLALHLSHEQADILAYNAGVSVTIKDFLEECGCPTIPLRYNDLKQYLPIFIERCKILQTCLKWADISEQKRRNRILLEKTLKEISLEMFRMHADKRKFLIEKLVCEIKYQAIAGLVTLINTVETVPDNIFNEALACVSQRP